MYWRNVEEVPVDIAYGGRMILVKADCPACDYTSVLDWRDENDGFDYTEEIKYCPICGRRLGWDETTRR